MSGPRAPRPLVDARDLVFRYSDRTQPVLRGCTLQISAGDRLVLEGASGGGKSTLVSLLAGLREPNSGRLLSTDSTARRSAPKLGANTSPPRRSSTKIMCWPKRSRSICSWDAVIIGPHDLAEAEAICAELGLGELLERMPAGLLQMVGETGWQLSHGERSRLYIARALLQDAELVVLDESFAALDPENLKRAVECVVKRAIAPGDRAP